MAPARVCAPWCNENTCDESECRECQDTDGCPRPPASPSPPPSPNDPPYPPAPPPPPCTQPSIGLTCMYSRCCENPMHTCFRKTGRRGSPYGYATCRLTCPTDGSYDCEILLAPPPLPPAPPPNLRAISDAARADCSASWKRCWETKCCRSAADGCFRRAGRQFAMCRPLARAGFPCQSTGDWICPGWEIPPPSPPAPPTTRPPALAEVARARPPHPPSPSHQWSPAPRASPGPHLAAISTSTQPVAGIWNENGHTGPPPTALLASDHGWSKRTLLVVGSAVAATLVCCLCLATTCVVWVLHWQRKRGGIAALQPVESCLAIANASEEVADVPPQLLDAGCAPPTSTGAACASRETYPLPKLKRSGHGSASGAAKIKYSQQRDNDDDINDDDDDSGDQYQCTAFHLGTDGLWEAEVRDTYKSRGTFLE